jgi:hypothetical protein
MDIIISTVRGLNQKVKLLNELYDRTDIDFVTFDGVIDGIIVRSIRVWKFNKKWFVQLPGTRDPHVVEYLQGKITLPK